ncbi:hypothetical protein P7C73_g6325, partial [Tremellales sp. Uapishka_1]
MPKPTFLQAVLRKPTRSYANPHAASPWADQVEEPYYAPASSHYEHGDEEHQRPLRRKAKSTVSVNADPTPSNRFPKPVKRVATAVVIKEDRIVHVSPTVKKKKEKRPVVQFDDSSASSSQVSELRRQRPTSINYHEGSLRTQSEASSSAPSSPIPPASPVSVQQPVSEPRKSRLSNIASQHDYPPSFSVLTPPSSDTSATTAGSSTSRHAPVKHVSLAPALPTIFVASPEPQTDNEDEAFHTPRSSLDTARPFSTDTAHPIDLSTAHPAPDHTSRSSPARTLVAPSLTIQPPTPAPLPDPDTSPFHSEPSSSRSSSSHAARSHRPSPSLEIPFANAPREEEVEDDIESAHGEAGSPEEEGQREFFEPRERVPSRPSSRAYSRPSSSVGSQSQATYQRPLSRQSTTRSGRNNYDDFVVRSRDSETSHRPQSAYGGSVKSGGGGWAAAAATRSGATSPVMFMPSGGDGWAAFQQPERQSKFTPLPPASQPTTFDRLLGAERGRSVAQTNSQRSGGGLRAPSADSSPSEYSQMSDGNPLPKPSRSYIKRSTDCTSENGSGGTQHPSSSDSYPERRHSPYHEQAPTQASYSRPSSVMSGLYHARSQPSLQSRPESTMSLSSPLAMHPPSFLNPDTLSFLPEMTEQDSDRLYQTSQRDERRDSRPASRQSFRTPSRQSFRPSSRQGEHPRRANSVFGFSKSGDNEDEGSERQVRKSKSVVGNSKVLDNERKWEGSSYGEGVLMQSNGLNGEASGGYTSLVLPIGAYTPLNPAKTASEINARILGLPHAAMAAITLSSSLSFKSATPLHLRHHLPLPVDFSSHLRPPTKVSNSQVLLQVYAVAIDEVDVKQLEDKGKSDVGKWVPGRSFAGRCLQVGAEEKEIVRGDLVIGLMDVRKSGALAEYITIDRRRLARAPFSTTLTLEQMALLPLQGIPASRAIRTHLVRGSRALLLSPQSGISALICQEMARAGVHITAVIAGGDDHQDSQTRCMAHGARGVLTGSPAAVMMNLEEGGWDFVLDTVGGVRVYEAAKRILKEGGKLVSLVPPDQTMAAKPDIATRPSGLKTWKAAFSKQKDQKTILYEYLIPAGSGGPEVDGSGVDSRDILEEANMGNFRPFVGDVWPFEKGAEAFRSNVEGRVVRLSN